MIYLREDDLKDIRSKVHFTTAFLFTFSGIWTALDNYRVYQDLNHDSVKYVIFCTILIVFTFIQKSIFKWLQILTLIFASSLCILINNEIGIIAEFPFLLGSFVLILAYGFFGDSKILFDIQKSKIAIYIIWFILIYIIKFILYNLDPFQYFLIYFSQYSHVFALGIILILCLKKPVKLFNSIILDLREYNEKKEKRIKDMSFQLLRSKKEIKKINKEIEKLAIELDKENALAEIGKATANAFHSLNNLICHVKMQGNLIENNLSDTDEIYNYVDVSINVINKIDTFIRNETNFIKHKISRSVMKNNIKEIIESSTFLFELEKKCIIEIDDSIGDNYIDVSASELKETIINLVKNSFEELAKTKYKRGNIVYINIYKINNIMEISIMDKGNGIEFCNNCNNECLKCTNFSIGKTTKKYGSGFGMIQVMDFCKKYNYGFKIESIINAYTKIIIKIGEQT